MKTILLIILFTLMGESLGNMRCYTSVSPHTSVQCGRGYSCLKVIQKPQVFDDYGQFVPETMRKKEEVVYRGCFVLDIHKDICFQSKTGLEYCWCSSKDLCNLATSKHLSSVILGLIIMKYLEIL